MPENGMPGPVCDLSSVREAVCIHTHKIFDSCRDKDCVEDLRFYPTASAQEVLSACQMVRGGTAELLYVYTDVEPVTFNRGFYSIDMRFFYRVTLQVGTGTPRCTEAEGLCVFDKRVILFGSEGSAKIFSSDTVLDDLDIPGCRRSNLPTAVVEAVDPIVLDARAEDRCKPCRCDCGLTEIPAFIAQSFDKYLSLFDEVTEDVNGVRRLKELLEGFLDQKIAEELETIIQSVDTVKTAKFQIVFDPTLVRGMSYYTGPIFEISIDGFGGSVGGGGRYDEMIGKFTGQKTCACGFSIGFERIVMLLLERDYQVPSNAGKKAYLIEKNMPGDKLAAIFKEAAEERKNGSIVSVNMMKKNKKFQKEQMTAEGYTEFKEFFCDGIK